MAIQLPLEKTVCHCKTKAEFDRLMTHVEALGWIWNCGGAYSSYKDQTCVVLRNPMMYSPKGYYEGDGYKVLTVDEVLGPQLVTLPQEKTVVACPTQKAWDALLAHLRGLGWPGCSGKWAAYGKDAAVRVDLSSKSCPGHYGNRNQYIKEGYKVIQVEDVLGPDWNKDNQWAADAPPVPKFKVGDRVRVVSTRPKSVAYCVWVPPMDHLLGAVSTVKAVSDSPDTSGNCMLADGFWYIPDWLTAVVEEVAQKKLTLPRAKHAVLCDTQEKWDRLLLRLEELGMTWNDGTKPSSHLEYWRTQGPHCCIRVEDKKLISWETKANLEKTGYAIIITFDQAMEALGPTLKPKEKLVLPREMTAALCTSKEQWTALLERLEKLGWSAVSGAKTIKDFIFPLWETCGPEALVGLGKKDNVAVGKLSNNGEAGITYEVISFEDAMAALPLPAPFIRLPMPMPMHKTAVLCRNGREWDALVAYVRPGWGTFSPAMPYLLLYGGNDRRKPPGNGFLSVGGDHKILHVEDVLGPDWNLRPYVGVDPAQEGGDSIGVATVDLGGVDAAPWKLKFSVGQSVRLAGEPDTYDEAIDTTKAYTIDKVDLCGQELPYHLEGNDGWFTEEELTVAEVVEDKASPLVGHNCRCEMTPLPLPLTHSDFKFEAREVSLTPKESWQAQPVVHEEVESDDLKKDWIMCGTSTLLPVDKELGDRFLTKEFPMKSAFSKLWSGVGHFITAHPILMFLVVLMYGGHKSYPDYLQRYGGADPRFTDYVSAGFASAFWMTDVKLPEVNVPDVSLGVGPITLPEAWDLSDVELGHTLLLYILVVWTIAAPLMRRAVKDGIAPSAGNGRMLVWLASPVSWPLLLAYWYVERPSNDGKIRVQTNDNCGGEPTMPVINKDGKVENIPVPTNATTSNPTPKQMAAKVA